MMHEPFYSEKVFKFNQYNQPQKIMANMSYCRFENTYSDLRDCVMHIELLTGGDATISKREWEYAKMMRSLCDDYLSLLDELEEQNAEDFYEEED